MNGKLKVLSIWLFVFLMLFLILALYAFQPGPKKTFSDLHKYIVNEDVIELKVYESKNLVDATLKDRTRIEVNIPSTQIFFMLEDEAVRKQIESNTLKLEIVPPPTPSWWATLLPILGGVFLLTVFFAYLQRMQGGAGKAMSFGRSKAKMINENAKKVTFADVAGSDEEKAELEEIVEFLKTPKKFTDLGARIPKGVLLVGPPGTGKTLLAKAVAGEAGVPFFSISGSDFVEMFVGVGASRVRDLFEQAKKHEPSIVFIDEIDAVGRQRGAGMGGGHDEREQTLNQLLVEMDGFGVNEGVIVIAATNRPDILDPALLRPGRFDRQVVVGRPDVKGRRQILDVHSKNKPLGSDVDLDVLAKTTAGFTGADLENLTNEAALLAARRDKKVLNMTELEESIIKVIAGPEKKTRVITEKERRLTAYHEAGHAIVTKLLPTQDPVHQVSIIPRGQAGGYTLSLPSEDKYYASKSEMIDEIIVLLGGRVAEKLVLDDISTGASNDLERATSIATKMITRYGMSDNLGSRTFGNPHSEVFLGRDYAQPKNYSESVATLIDDEIKLIIDSCFGKCADLINENIDKLHCIAGALLEKETIDGDEFEELFTKGKIEKKKKEISENSSSDSNSAKPGDPDSPEPTEKHSHQSESAENDNSKSDSDETDK